MIPHLDQFSFGDTIYHIMSRSCSHFIELYYLTEMGYYHFIEKRMRFYCSSSKSIVDYVYSVHTAGRMKWNRRGRGKSRDMYKGPMDKTTGGKV